MVKLALIPAVATVSPGPLTSEDAAQLRLKSTTERVWAPFEKTEEKGKRADDGTMVLS
jgi:hypothetical protein